MDSKFNRLLQSISKIEYHINCGRLARQRSLTGIRQYQVHEVAFMKLVSHLG